MKINKLHDFKNPLSGLLNRNENLERQKRAPKI